MRYSNIRAASKFDITQVSSEKNLLISIANTFFGGTYNLSSNSLALHLVITNLNFFSFVHQKYVEPSCFAVELLTRKYLDFLIWQEVLNLINNKVHLTSSGVDSIKELRELQHLHRKLIDPSIIDQVLTLRPDWESKLKEII